MCALRKGSINRRTMQHPLHGYGTSLICTDSARTQRNLSVLKTAKFVPPLDRVLWQQMPSYPRLLIKSTIYCAGKYSRSSSHLWIDFAISSPICSSTFRFTADQSGEKSVSENGLIFEIPVRSIRLQSFSAGNKPIEISSRSLARISCSVVFRSLAGYRQGIPTAFARPGAAFAAGGGPI